MQLFHFWSRDVHPVQKLLLCTQFHQNPMIFHWDMAIYRFSKWRPSATLELFYHHTRPPTKSLLLAAAACQISCQSNTQIWRHIAIWIFRIFGLKCLFRPPKWRFWKWCLKPIGRLCTEQANPDVQTVYAAAFLCRQTTKSPKMEILAPFWGTLDP